MALKFNLPIGGYTSVIDLTPVKNPANNSVIAVNSVVISDSGSSFTLDLPEPAGNDDYSGSIIVIKNTGSDDITITQEGSNQPKINGGDSDITLEDGNTAIFYYIDTTEGWHSFYNGTSNG